MPRSVWRHGDPVTLPLRDRGGGITAVHKKHPWSRAIPRAAVPMWLLARSPPCLFVYGTLMADEVLVALLGRAPARRQARIHGFVRGCVRGEAFPAVLRAGAEQSVDGLLIENLLPRELEALDFYEDEGYERITIPVTTADGTVVEAMMYLWPQAQADEVDRDRAWSYADFRETRLESFVRDIVVPCAAEFEEEERAAAAQAQRRRRAVAAAVAAVGVAAVVHRVIARSGSR
jgi:gamma-glutamylcyclotransferase (GGCT)/AIG2-like uncharacterized protein YtfP